MATMQKEKYRDKLVSQIKLMGQELIDRAEEMVDENTELISDFHISIDFPQDTLPTITFETTILSKNLLKSYIEHIEKEN